MPQVSGVIPQKKDKTRVNVYIDGVFAFALDLETAVSKKIQAGKELTRDEIELLVKKGEYAKVLDKVMNFLSFRPRSKREIEDYFQRKQIGEEVQKLIVPQLEKWGYMDDLEFAKWWVKQRKEFRPRGKRQLVAELFKKGINKKIIDEVLLEQSGEDEEKICLEIAKKRMVSYRKLSVPEAKIKLGQYLARKGFDWETIKRVVGKVID